MKVTRHAAAREFLDRSESWLRLRTAEHNLLLGLAHSLVRNPRRYPSIPWFLTAGSGKNLETVSIMTPPFKAVVTFGSPSAIQAVADFYYAQNAPVPGVLGPTDQARAFAKAWTGLTGKTFRPGRAQGVYVSSVVIPPRPAPGRFRRVQEEDRALFERFLDAFMKEVGLEGEGEDAERRVEDLIAEQRTFFWDHDGPVSVAAWTGATPDGVRVSMVYTPPEHRGQGYASNTVAALTQQIFNEGRGRAFLFTDMGNPVSNSIYQRIGYEKIMEFHDFFFEEE